MREQRPGASEGDSTDAPVLVTGIGIVSPLGPLPGFWDGLCRGSSGIVPIDWFDPGPTPPGTAARVRDWNAKDHIRPAQLRRMDRLSQMVLTACHTALADAGLSLDAKAAEDAGVVVGTALGDISETEDFLRGLLQKGPARANPFTFPNLVLNAAAGYVAIDLGLRGPNFTVCRGEVSGEAALALAYDTIVSGQADVLLAGGGDEIAPLLFHVYKDAGALSPGRRGWQPSHQARTSSRSGPERAQEGSSPFDRGRNGFVMGEGVAMLVLERGTHAAARGARAYGALTGYETWSVRTSAHDWPPPEAATPITTVSPEPIDLVISCANSTLRLDAYEAAHLALRLGETAGRAFVTSIKGAIGDFGAAGALSAAAAVLALARGELPRLGSIREPDPTCHLRLATPDREPPGHGFQRAFVSGVARGGGCIGLHFRRV